MQAPVARSAASQLPGETTVSGSSQLWSRLRDGSADHFDIGLRVQPLDRGQIGARRLLALQRLEGGRGKRIVDGAQAVGPLGVAVAGVVQEAGGVGEEQRGHERTGMVPGRASVPVTLT